MSQRIKALLVTKQTVLRGLFITGCFVLGSLIAGVGVLLARSLLPTHDAVAVILGFSVLALLAACGFLGYDQYERAKQKRKQLEQF